MAKRSQTGKMILQLRAVRPADVKKDEDFDPVLSKWSDPATCSDRTLRRMICEAGGVKVCQECVCYDRCQYGRELVRRAKCRQEKKPAAAASIPLR